MAVNLEVDAKMRKELMDEYETITNNSNVLEYYKLSSMSFVDILERKENISQERAYYRVLGMRDDFLKKTPGLREKIRRLKKIVCLLDFGEHWKEDVIDKAERILGF